MVIEWNNGQIKNRKVIYNIVAAAGDHCWDFQIGFSTAAAAQEIIDSYNGYYTDNEGCIWDLIIVPVLM